MFLDKLKILFIGFTSIILLQQQDISAQSIDSSNVIELSLSKCIDLTLKNNNSRKSYQYAVKAAEARLKQAQSAHYPSLDFTGVFSRLDQDPNYIIPSSIIQMPPINLGSLSIPPIGFPVPEQNIKIADKQNFQTELNLVLPIFTGGKISSYVDQAQNAIMIARNDSQLNDEQIIYETKKLFFSVILASELEKIARDTYEQMNGTLELTESLYKNGSGRVTKSDYLKNKTMVDVVKTMLEQISGEKNSAVAALIYTMGLDWQTRIKINADEIPIKINDEPLEYLVARMINNNPQFSKIDNALKVYDARIDEAKSDYLPSIALVGSYRKSFNNYDYGMMTKENKNVWMMGIGISMNLFNGFRTDAKVDENKAELNQLLEQKEMLKKGLTLKLQYIYYKLHSAAEKEKSALSALNSAKENTGLIERAYYNDLMDLEDLIQAQITEALMNAQYNLIRFEYADLEAQLELLLAGSDINSTQ